jgi:hypothetical protein
VSFFRKNHYREVANASTPRDFSSPSIWTSES